MPNLVVTYIMKKVVFLSIAVIFILNIFISTASAGDSFILSQIDRLTFTALRFFNTSPQDPFNVILSRSLGLKEINHEEYSELSDFSNAGYDKYKKIAQYLALKAEKTQKKISKHSLEEIPAQLLIAKMNIDFAASGAVMINPCTLDLWSPLAQAVQLLSDASNAMRIYQLGEAPASIALFHFYIALGFDALHAKLPDGSLKSCSHHELYNKTKYHLESAQAALYGTKFIRQYEFYRLTLMAFKEYRLHNFRPAIIEWGTIQCKKTGFINQHNPFNQKMKYIYSEAQKKAAKTVLDSKSFEIATMLSKAYTPRWQGIGISIFEKTSNSL